MTRKEKELIAKIQLSQLITDDPYSDDFYYQMFTEKKNNEKQGESKLNWQQTYLMKQGKGGNLSSQMQQQVQHLIDGRKQKPKNNQCNFFFLFLFFYFFYFYFYVYFYSLFLSKYFYCYGIK